MSFYDLLVRKNTVCCEQCGSTIWSHEHRLNDGDNTFCGVECKEEYYEDNAPTVPVFSDELPLEYNQQQLELSL
jgi:hypothetical protein